MKQNGGGGNQEVVDLELLFRPGAIFEGPAVAVAS